MNRHECEFVFLLALQAPGPCVDCGRPFLPVFGPARAYAWLRLLGLTIQRSIMARRRSKQRKHGGGKFKSEKQRRFMWAKYPKAAKKWAHNRSTTKGDWRASPTRVARRKKR